MKARLLLALLAAVLTTTACGDSVTGPAPHILKASLQSGDSVTTTTSDGPLQGSGTRS